jgi:hypothetical protein
MSIDSYRTYASSPSVSFAVLALVIANRLGAQSPATTTTDSVGRAVQRFYNWYLPRFAKPGTRNVMMLAATHGPIPFDSTLVHWLRVDSIAQARAKGEIDGLDGDPYLNAQDPCDAYTVKAIRQRGTDLLVDVLGHGGCAAHQKPDVTVALGLRAGRWTILEFLDPSRRNEGVIPLIKSLYPKAR